MANEIRYQAPVGGTYYALIRKAAGAVWDVSLTDWTDPPVPANIDNYDVPLADRLLGYYEAAFPVGIDTAAIYAVQIRERAGGAPADGDIIIASGLFAWDGAAWINLSTTDLALDDISTSVSNIGSGGTGATNHEMTDDNVLGALTYGGAFVGTEAAGTFLTTASDPATYHQIDNDAGNINIVYYTNVGGNRQAVNVLFQGYLDFKGRIGTVQIYDFVGTAWDTLYALDGTNLNENTVEPPMRLLSKHTGTGVELGDVYIRFVTAAQAGADFFNGVFLVAAVNTSDSVGYSDGSIWVDTVNGTPGTIPFTNGAADNAVLTWADALTLSAALSIIRFHIINGSTITLTANSDNYTLIGEEWTLALGGQSCEDASFTGAHVSGICTGDEVIFRDCDLAAGGANLTVAGIEAHSCGISGSIVLTAANTYYLDNCYSGIAGVVTPDIDFGAAVGNVNLNIRHYSGGIEILNMGRAGTDLMSLEGFGQLVINANCDPSTNPVIAIRGHFDIIDNVAGGFVAGGGVLSDTPRFASDDLSVDVRDAIVDDASLATAAELNKVKGAVAGKVVRNATGTEIKFYAFDGTLLSTVTLVGGTWSVAWAP